MTPVIGRSRRESRVSYGICGTVTRIDCVGVRGLVESVDEDRSGIVGSGIRSSRTPAATPI